MNGGIADELKHAERLLLKAHAIIIESLADGLYKRDIPREKVREVDEIIKDASSRINTVTAIAERMGRGG